MIIKCSNCDKQLLEIDDQTVNTNETVFKSYATCPYCKDKSFVFDFYRNSRASGIGVESEVKFDIVKDGDISQQTEVCPDFKLITVINNFTRGEGNTWVFQIGKA